MKNHSGLAVAALLVSFVMIAGFAADARATGGAALPSSHMIASVP